MDTKISDILKELKELCEGHDSVLPNEKCLGKLDNLEYIIIGDNPGREERAGVNQKILSRYEYLFDQQYFIGNKTNYIHEFFRRIYKTDGKDYKKYVLFLNKTPISTDNTPSLKKIKNDPVFLKTQEKMAELINEIILKTKSVSVWIMGYTYLESWFKTFWDGLENKNVVYIFKHPSRTWFLRDVEKVLNKKITKAEFNKFSGAECKALLEKLKVIGINHKKRYL